MSLALRVPLSFFLPKPETVRRDRVLLVRDDVIGDLVVPTSAAVSWLKSQGFDVFLVCRENLTDAARLLLPEDRLIPFNISLYRNNLSYRYSLLKSIREKGFSVAIGSTMHSSVNMDIVRCCGAAVKWGYKRNTSLKELSKFIGVKSVCSLPVMTGGRYTSVLEHEQHFQEGISGRSAESFAPVFSIPDSKPLIKGRYLHYISDAGNMRRAFPKERIIPVLEELAEKLDVKVVITGLQEVEAGGERVVNLSGRTSLSEVINIVSHASYVVGNESGITHMAWIIGKPTAVFYGGGHYGRFLPAGNSLLLTNKPSDCFCCDWKCIYNEKLFPCINLPDDTLREQLERFFLQ